MLAAGPLARLQRRDAERQSRRFQTRAEKVQSINQRVRLNAVSAFANCGRAVAFVRGSYVPDVTGPSFDHLVGASEQRGRHCEAERLGSS